jgi:hypothetical protein
MTAKRIFIECGGRQSQADAATAPLSGFDLNNANAETRIAANAKT